MRAAFVALCAVAVCHAQTDPSILLQRATQKVLDAVSRLPRYICTQTIDRSQFEPTRRGSEKCEPAGQKRLRLTTSDRLHLDVAVTAGHEMYSWVGESHFENRSVFELTPRGAMSTGAFAQFLESIFRDDSAQFTYEGETAQNGRRVSEFDFRVPASTSHYIFHGGEARVTTGYTGAVFLDPQTAELIRLTVETEGLPEETGSCDARTSLDYHQVALNGADFLLPSRVELHIANRDGVELENATTYSACREFLGESVLSFDQPENAAGTVTRASAAENNQLAETLPFTIETMPVNASTAAAGDRIEAKLTAPMRDLQERIVAPQGAAVRGRIIEMRRFYIPAPMVRMVFKLESVEVAGAWRTLKAIAQSMEPNLVSPKGGLARRHSPVTPDNQDAGAAVFQITRPDRDMLPPFESKWRATTVVR